MTTKHSPLRILKAQADQVAALIKAAERGDVHPDAPPYFADRVAEARKRGSLKFGIAMDDKLLAITIRFDVIRNASEAGLAEYILDQMLETKVTRQ